MQSRSRRFHFDKEMHHTHYPTEADEKIAAVILNCVFATFKENILSFASATKSDTGPPTATRIEKHSAPRAIEQRIKEKNTLLGKTGRNKSHSVPWG